LFSALGTQDPGAGRQRGAHCKLPEEADLQLHMALIQVLDGINAMIGSSGQEQGAVAIVEALNAYGEHFTPPEWNPLGGGDEFPV
jgi:hypothetical protein